MGLTPLEGLMMGTRSGDIDPNFHLLVQEREKRTLSEITDMLTRRSGLLGVSGVSHGKSTGGRITAQSGLLCLVIKTNEELMIARETARLTS
jgi:acetate kinase